MAIFQNLIDNFKSVDFWIYAFLCISLVSMISWILVVSIRGILRLFDKLEFVHLSYKRRLFVFSSFLIVAIFCFKYAIGLCQVHLLDNKYGLTKTEELFRSFIYALHIFGIDDGFNEYINDVKDAMAALFGAESKMVFWGSFYSSLLSAAAPVAGGAIIFEIIASIFPTFISNISNIKIWREKYYFSELNENTIALIKSINKEYKRRLLKPVMIITDSYIDDENEAQVELVNEAKLLGAICVKNDIVHIRKNYFGRRKFFLIDVDENVNIRKLLELTERLGPHYVKKSEFYPFIINDVYSSVIPQIRKNLGVEENGLHPVILPINRYRNIILNMFSDVPLFEPIVHPYNDDRNKKDTELNITILGTGQIGTEMFLGTYWCGQMLGCKLHITVISMESHKEFESRINYLNPEIFKSKKAGDPILKIYREDKFAPEKSPKAPHYSEPYFSYDYIQHDVTSESFIVSKNNIEVINKTNYFFVALGSDEENIQMANKLREMLGNSHMENDELRRTVIAYVVFDSFLCEALNAQSFYSYSKNKNKKDIYMKALGSIEELFSVRNVFLTEFSSNAETENEKYFNSAATRKRRKYSDNLFTDEYNYASSAARRVHRKYKVFSAGMWEKSIFDFAEEYQEMTNVKRKEKLTLEEEYKALGKQYWNAYVEAMKRLCASKENHGILHELAWLEHRRWNAYMRSRGFCGPQRVNEDGTLNSEKTLEYIKNFLGINDAQKKLDLKRHICLVECDRYGIKADMDSSGDFNNYKLWNITNKEEYDAVKPDMLDEVSIIMSNAAYRPDGYTKTDGREYKEYDYPFDDFIKYVSVETFAEKTGMTPGKVRRLCKRKKIAGVVVEDWRIPQDAIDIFKK